MRRMLMIMLLSGWVIANAQTPSADPESADGPLPCVPADEIKSADSDPENSDEAAVPCEESSIESEIAESDMIPEGPVTEATADEVFKPGDEISEDYPVPLPADI